MSDDVSLIKAVPSVDKKAARETERPKKYSVVLLNDDYTPMDFVVVVLKKFFFKESAEAVRVMLDIHQKGKAICGTYSRDVAETKVAQVNDFARQHEHPLLCKMIEEDG